MKKKLLNLFLVMAMLLVAVPVVAAAPPPQDVVGCAALELDEPQLGLDPGDTVVRRGIADRHFPSPGRSILFLVPLLKGHPLCRIVNDKGAVPALEDLLLLVVDDVGVEIVETLLPWLVFFKERVVFVLLHFANE